MLKIYTRKIDIPKNKFINYVDRHFNTIMYDITIDTMDEKCLHEIDKAKYLGNGRMETIFGITTIEKLSTGCKALILIHHFPETIININECGENALDMLYNVIDKGSIYIDFPLHPNNYNSDKEVILCRQGKQQQCTLSKVFERLDK